MTTADILILLSVILIIGLILFFRFKNRNKDKCRCCSHRKLCKSFPECPKYEEKTEKE